LDDGALVFSHDNAVLASVVVVVVEQTYVTNGLVFHLDGKDATTDRWVDRVGGIAFTMSNISLGNNGGVVFNGSAYGFNPNTLGFEPATHTIEVVADRTVGSGSVLLFMQNGDNLLAFGIGQGTGDGDTDQLITSSGTTVERMFRASNILRGLAVVSVADISAIQNKSSITKDDGGYFGKRSVGGTFIGARSTNENLFVGTIYQIRIYNRLLSAAEISANQQIDINKYNIS
jgi:hypothetical protein